jgi:thioredoxin 1
MLKPVFEDLQRNFSNKEVVFQEIDIDKFPEKASTNGVRSIPTVIIYRNGVEVERLTGVRSKVDYVNVINKHLIFN